MTAVLTSRKMDMENCTTTSTCRIPRPFFPDSGLPFMTSTGRKPDRYAAG